MKNKKKKDAHCKIIAQQVEVIKALILENKSKD